ncbi:trypsin-like serine protease [Streptomyces sp. NPDC057638]|uniref:trypsin-like serine protease n=1 Tax=Streptomyces sp. NPDC057638 TaxID=3346190 RepID=UPI0036CF1B3D
MQIRTRDGRRKRRVGVTAGALGAAVALVGGVITVASPATADEVPGAGAGASAAEQSQEQREKVVRKLTKAKPAKSGIPVGDAQTQSLVGGNPNARIIGGKETTISAAPWMAQLYFVVDGDLYSCGGAVIAPTKIATAAHCVEGVKWKETGEVVLGATKAADYSEATPKYFGGTPYGVVRQWHHTKYDPYSLENDVAVLTLDKPTTIKPLPLAQPTDTAIYKSGTDGKVYGWGRTGTGLGDGSSDTLKVADADVVSDTKCKAAYPSGVAKFVAGQMLCAGAAPTGQDETSETTCHGDSGGPLVVGGRLAGIVSWGDPDCVAEGKYGVYAKFSTYSAAFQARVDDANWNGDHTADLLSRRTSDNRLFSWTSSVKKLVRSSANHGNIPGWSLTLQTDLNRDDNEDLLYRDSKGDIYWSRYVPSKNDWSAKLVAKGWGKHKHIVTPGDVTGDELPDMLAVDSTGTLRVYPGKGDGGFSAPVRVGTGWGSFTMVRGHGDFTNDGKADVFARASDGKTYLYKGTGVAAKPFATPVLVGLFGSMNALVTTGDVNSDNVADILARDTKGKLWLYPGKGDGKFLPRVDFGSGWQAYNLFG